MKFDFQHANFDLSFTEDDVVEPSDMIPAGEFNPHNIHPWFLHDAGFCLAVVFASSLQDALDTAADAGKLDRFQAKSEDVTEDAVAEGVLTALGGACEYFDIEGIDYIQWKPEDWSQQMWTTSQLEDYMEELADRLGIIGTPLGVCGLKQDAREAEWNKLKTTLEELWKRRQHV